MGIKTEKDVLALISNKVEESIAFEYKQCAALSHDERAKNEIGKDVAAFANSAGGVIIYGIKEDGHIPVAIDNGIDPRETAKEWLEAIIDSRISPKIDGIVINPIELKETRPGRYVYVVEIPRSLKAPHQSSDRKYYKRYNFKSMPMEDYEIKDVANRRAVTRPLIVVDTFIRHSSVVCLSIKNIGEEVAVNVKLVPDRDIKLRGDRPSEDVPIFSKGVRYFPPGKEFVFWYGTFPEIVKGETKPSTFSVKVIYNKLNDPLTELFDDFFIDINDYFYTTTKTSLIEEELKSIREAIVKLTGELLKKMEGLSSLQDMTGNTGLQLSVDTLRNIKHIINNEPFEKINALNVSHGVFMEVLGLDVETAYKIYQWLVFDKYADPVQKYSLSPRALEEFNKYFTVPCEPQ